MLFDISFIYPYSTSEPCWLANSSTVPAVALFMKLTTWPEEKSNQCLERANIGNIALEHCSFLSAVLLYLQPMELSFRLHKKFC